MKYLILTSLVLFSLPVLSFAQQGQQSRCKTQPEYRQFDFWIGEWEVKNPNDVVVGNSEIELVVGDCLILENWISSRGTTGKSMNYYNLYDKKWHQLWIGSGGIPIEFIGDYNTERKSMDYIGRGTGPNGESLDYKFTFFHISDDHVRQLWEQSSDNGESWVTIFDGQYHRKK
tara:strand:- start:6386 stop:6904 length:519 start_codon:yes stop_codon:yes gene_type:complete